MSNTNAIVSLVALVVAILMIAASMSVAFAAGETGNQTLDGTISVTSLKEGDAVTFYRVLKFSSDATTTGGWVNDNGFTLTDAEIQKALAIEVTGTAPNQTYKQVTITEANKTQYGIDETLAAKIADMAEVSGITCQKYEVTADSEGKASQANPAEGLYVAIITAAEAGDLYNPVFVGADYKENSSNTWAVSINDSYQPASMAKKGTVTLTKTASTTEAAYEDSKPQTVAVGDTISFTVTTTIPEFANNYTNARFFITDQLTKGLDLKTDTIKVYKGSAAADCIDANALTAADTYAEGVAYKLTTTEASLTTVPAASNQANGDKYVVDFYTKYLLDLDAKQPIIITYDATVLDTAINSVNLEDNTVTLNFSNNPLDGEGRGILKDETKHYTFDIDADLLGKSSYHATEVVKIGLDKDGNEITKTTTLNNEGKIGALQGAEFKLYVADPTSSTKIKNETGAEISASLYTNEAMKGEYTIVSDKDGRLTVKDATTAGIRGLDAGTYYLVETKAPDGYIKAQNGVKIEIDATIENVEHKLYYNKANGETAETKDADHSTEVKWEVPELKSYTVKINGVTTATYTMTNEKPDEGDKVGSTNVGDDDDSGKIKNTQGVELPSTGGIGTTIFYVAGSILVLAAAILLITKRRMGSEE